MIYHEIYTSVGGMLVQVGSACPVIRSSVHM